MRLAIVTATTNIERAQLCVRSWRAMARHEIQIVGVLNGRTPGMNQGEFDVVLHHEPDYLGTVAAFERGVGLLLETTRPPEIIACLHDDLRIDEKDWDETVIRHFQRTPRCGLAGFGGAIGLADVDIYRKPYQPQQLARIGFRSALDDAEIHGIHSLLPERVACLDGFSQIGRRDFWDGYRRNGNNRLVRYGDNDRPWTVLDRLGVVHHAYDGMLGCLAKRYHWDVWYLPIRGHHYGGQTAVGDEGYANWAKTQNEDGDHGFWEKAHQIWYDNFRSELPIRL